MVVSQNNNPRDDEGRKQVFNRCSFFLCFFASSFRSASFSLVAFADFLTHTADHQQPRPPVGALLNLQYRVVGSSLPSVKVIDTFRWPNYTP